MLDSLGKILHRQGLRLEYGMGGICLLTVIHSTRIEADINRDSRCLTGEIYILSEYSSPPPRCSIPETDHGDPDSDPRGAAEGFPDDSPKQEPQL